MPLASLPGALISLGFLAPQARIILSYSFSNLAALTSLPTFTPVINSTPSALIISILRSITCFSSFILGIPYIRSPPTRSSRSYTVTRCPRLLSWSAAASPAGPEPMIATFFPVRTFGGFAAVKPCSYACSIMPNSFSLTDTASP